MWLSNVGRSKISEEPQRQERRAEKDGGERGESDGVEAGPGGQNASRP